MLLSDESSTTVSADLKVGTTTIGATAAVVVLAFRPALAAHPRDPSVYVNRSGYLRLARGDRQAAAEFFAEALAIDATSESAKRGLAELRGYP